jgi:hypothetical protein
MNKLGGILYLIFSVATAMIEYTISNSGLDAFWAFIFTPFFWIYWLVTHEINLTIIKETFAFFLK